MGENNEQGLFPDLIFGTIQVRLIRREEVGCLSQYCYNKTNIGEVKSIYRNFPSSQTISRNTTRVTVKYKIYSYISNLTFI